MLEEGFEETHIIEALTGRGNRVLEHTLISNAVWSWEAARSDPRRDFTYTWCVTIQTPKCLTL
jgi:hypothetical protein